MHGKAPQSRPLANTNDTHLLTDRRLASRLVQKTPIFFTFTHCHDNAYLGIKKRSRSVILKQIPIIWCKYCENWFSGSRDADCTTSYILNSGSLNRISPNYAAEIKTAIFQSVWKRKRDEWRSSSNYGRIIAKITRLNSVNSEITARKFTKFGNDVAWLLPFNRLKVDLRSVNPLSNATAPDVCNISHI